MAETSFVAGQPAGPIAVAGAGVNGEILFLAHRVPFPPNRGDKIRSWNILKALTQIAPVHVCALLDEGDHPEDVAAVKEVAASVHVETASLSKLSAVASAALTGQSASVLACSSKALQRHIDRLCESRSISATYAFSGQMAQFVRRDLGANRFVMDFVDMDSAKFTTWADTSSGPKRWANQTEANRLFAFEEATAKRAAVSLFVSEAECELFRSKTGLGQSEVQPLENGIDLAHFDPELSFASVEAGEGPLIVFTGQMDYAPNVEAVSDFAKDVLPEIRTSHANASFAIVGRAPTPAVRALAKLPGVIVTGAVADTRDWLAAADVVVAPLKLARGIQNKVLEAMAMAKPVVASSAAAQGIDAKAGRDLIVADDSQEQARAILALLNEPEQSEALATAARAQMVGRYGWAATLSRLPELIGFAA